MSTKNAHRLTPFGPAMTSAEYAEQWMLEAKGFRARADYRWMAAKLNGATTILEIGCGSGESTAALLKETPRGVVVVEQNLHLIAEAKNNLRSLGIPVHVVPSGQGADPPRVGEVVLVPGSVRDRDIEERLKDASIDAIACWLIGAEFAAISDALSVPMEVFCGDELSRYRWQIHQRCYEIGRQLLDQGQTVHFVDRGAVPLAHWAAIGPSDYAGEHLEKAGEGYEITVENIAFRRLEGAGNRSAIKYVADRDVAPIERVPVLSSLRAVRL